MPEPEKPGRRFWNRSTIRDPITEGSGADIQSPQLISPEPLMPSNPIAITCISMDVTNRLLTNTVRLESQH